LAGGAETRTAAVIARAFACSAELGAHIAGLALSRSYPQRASILRSGDRAQSVYLVVDGCANAIAYSLDGRLVLVADYRAGDLFGEGSLLGDIRIEEDFVAVEPTEAAIFRALTFVGLMETHSGIALAVSRVLTQRLNQANRRLVEGATLSSNGRVHAELLRQARLQGGNTIRPAPVLSEFALRVQVARETVSRAISVLEKRGIITRDARELTIIAPHRLEELVR
jgi:CRP/FNR family transcriptional regulator, cyclic AMP receptor protein